MANNVNNQFNVAIVGYGYIAKYWEDAILRNGKINIVEIYDNKITDKEVNTLKFYKNLSSLLENDKLNTCITCTPTDNHYETAMEVLSSGKNAVIEKPSVLNMHEYNNLLEKAEQNHVFIYNAFHFVYSPEIAWFRNSLNDVFKSHGRIGSLYSYFSDPYYTDGKLKNRALSLLGSWVDSGSNILSMLYSIFEYIAIDSLTLGGQYNGKYSDLFSTAPMMFKDSRNGTGFGHTVTNWVSNSSFKYTDFMFPETNSKIRLNHSQLKVTLSDATGIRVLFSSNENNRLLAHYYGLVDALYQVLLSGKGNEEYWKMVYSTMYALMNGGESNA
ncbi:Gfo/Idh/MocA family protein [Acidiplasma aeolicum]|nr:Gfo/Idh/MocA family oxidoreductase [Acidiplasma aeolicum]